MIEITVFERSLRSVNTFTTGKIENLEGKIVIELKCKVKCGLWDWIKARGCWGHVRSRVDDKMERLVEPVAKHACLVTWQQIFEQKMPDALKPKETIQ